MTTDLASLMADMLEHACGNLTESEVAANDDFQEYMIETHCVGYKIVARPHGEFGAADRTWEIQSFERYAA